MNAPTRSIRLDLNGCDAKTGEPKVAESARRGDRADGAIARRDGQIAAAAQYQSRISSPVWNMTPGLVAMWVNASRK
jgi:hypothetical protein